MSFCKMGVMPHYKDGAPMLPILIYVRYLVDPDGRASYELVPILAFINNV